MLKDRIFAAYSKLLDKRYGEKFPFKLRGEVEVIAKENGKIFHYDKGDNTVTVWGKHMVMHLLTGEVFSEYGKTRDGTHVAAGDTLKNSDGTLISGRQYFDASTFPGSDGWWSRPAAGDSADHLYTYFPVKILLGTGFEWKNWASITDSAYTTKYTSDGWSSTTFNYSSPSTALFSANNDYSSEYPGSYPGDTVRLTNCRSMNDIYSTTLTTPAITDTDFAVKGAIKNALYENSVGDTGKLELVSGNYFPTKNYWGVGRPAFIYARRESRFDEVGTEIALDFDSTVENKITFTVTLPEQTSVNAGIFYPHNGFVLKQAGLFCDSRFFLKNTVPANKAASDDTGLTEYANYIRMPHGIMMAKRYIAPITKLHSVSITVRWTIYL